MLKLLRAFLFGSWASRLSRDREVVIPAYAGIQNFLERHEISNWIPAYAGMTDKVLILKLSFLKWEAGS